MAYSLSTHFAGQGLLDSFNFFTGEDANYGFANYQSREAALASNLVSIDEFNRVKLGVDSINTYSTNGTGRPSVRITSNDDFTYGLFIADFAHMPSSTCGTWPAFWAFNNDENGSHWPTGGEIDIIQGANTAQRNLISAHTTAACQAPKTGFVGVQGATDCSSSAKNIGCNYAAPTSGSATYGDAFNAEGGGVYALEWDSRDIKIWHFPRKAIPDDIKLAPVRTPDPTKWGPPQALFGGSTCEADSHFYNMSLVINTNFCGAYAGKIWGVADQCDKLAPTCEEYVAKNPSSFINTFWQINYIDIYQKPVLANSTFLHPLPSNTTVSTRPVSSTTSLSVLRSTSTVIPSRTRTITVSTITQVMATAEPIRTGGGLADPTTIKDSTLLGCFGSPAGYKSFTQAASSAKMDIEVCVTSCAGHKYAGVSGETCYCADVLGDATSVANDLCDIPCPGNAGEICGGAVSESEKTSPSFAGVGFALAKLAKSYNGTSSKEAISIPRVDPLLTRAAPPTALLTLYGAIAADIPPPAPALGGPPSHKHGHGHAEAQAAAAAAALTSAVTVTFTSICPTDAARLITLEYRTTLTAPAPSCSCSAAAAGFVAAPAVPMTTYAATCAACGPRGESTVTLTVPRAVAAGTADAHVVALAVQTVVPVLAAPNASVPSAATLRPPAASSTPVVGAGTATVGRTAGFVQTLGYGVALWFMIFGIGMVL
ncbi:glycoside hydrolase family 16 protein [Nemania diffusa]|nr:glycoside hydrolase family 16 protein [Nemania diffusa]